MTEARALIMRFVAGRKPLSGTDSGHSAKVEARLPDTLRVGWEKALRNAGLTASDAIRQLVTKVVSGEMPLDPKPTKKKPAK